MILLQYVQLELRQKRSCSRNSNHDFSTNYVSHLLPENNFIQFIISKPVDTGLFTI